MKCFESAREIRLLRRQPESQPPWRRKVIFSPEMWMQRKFKNVTEESNMELPLNGNGGKRR